MHLTLSKRQGGGQLWHVVERRQGSAVRGMGERVGAHSLQTEEEVVRVRHVRRRVAHRVPRSGSAGGAWPRDAVFFFGKVLGFFRSCLFFGGAWDLVRAMSAMCPEAEKQALEGLGLSTGGTHTDCVARLFGHYDARNKRSVRSITRAPQRAPTVFLTFLKFLCCAVAGWVLLENGHEGAGRR